MPVSIAIPTFMSESNMNTVPVHNLSGSDTPRSNRS